MNAATTPRRSISPLPDRERRHLLQFYIAPGWGYGQRLAWAGGLILAAMVLQALWRPESPVVLIVVSAPLLLAGTLLLLVRGYNTQPEGIADTGDWEKTTLDRLAAVGDLEKRTRSWDEAVVDLTCVTGFVVFVLVGGAVAGATFLLMFVPGLRDWAPVFAVDAGILLLPLWITGTRRGWRPVRLRQQIDALTAALAVIQTRELPPCQVQPMFEMAGGGARRTPIGARVLVRFPDGPESFLGLQLQVALNDVQGTQYPYLYAVIIARSEFGLHRKQLASIRRAAPDNIVVEPSSESDVEVIVIRQHTTRTKGYHTKPDAIARLTAFAWDCVHRMLPALPT